MTNKHEMTDTWGLIAIAGDWFVITNENGLTGVEIAISDTLPTEPGGHSLKYGEGMTLNTGGSNLYGRCRKAGKTCKVTVTDWATV